MTSNWLKRGRIGLGRFSIEHLWCLIVLAGVFIFNSTHPIRPHDFWWHVRGGQEVAKTGHIFQQDVFSFTAAGEPYRAYQIYWLAELGLYLLYSLGGAALVIFAHTLVITTAYALLLWLCKQLSHSWRIAAASTLFAAALGINDWNVRPQPITFLLGVIFVWARHQYRQKPQRRWLVVFPVGMVVWANTHGTFPIGLFVLGVWLGQETWEALAHKTAWSPAPRRSAVTCTATRCRWQVAGGRLLTPAVVICVTAMACLITPQGLGIVAYLKGMSANPVVQNLTPEWASPSFDSLRGSIFFIALLFSISVLALSRRQPSFAHLFTFLAFAGLSLKTSRGIVWFGLMTAPILAEHLPNLAEQLADLFDRPGQTQPPSQVSRATNYVLASLVLLAVLLTLPCFKASLPLPEIKASLLSAETPVEATAFMLREKPPGPLFNYTTFGSYLIWQAQPEYPVFVDTRLELYPADLWQDYLNISTGHCDWEQRLTRYNIKTLMVSPQDQRGLVRAADESPNWQRIYEDRYTVIFTATNE